MSSCVQIPARTEVLNLASATPCNSAAKKSLTTSPKKYPLNCLQLFFFHLWTTGTILVAKREATKCSLKTSRESRVMCNDPRWQKMPAANLVCIRSIRELLCANSCARQAYQEVALDRPNQRRQIEFGRFQIYPRGRRQIAVARGGCSHCRQKEFCNFC